MKVENNVRHFITKSWKNLVDISKELWISYQQLSAIQNNKPKKISYKTIGLLISYFWCEFNDLFKTINNG